MYDQVTIGSQDLKANHAIEQIVEVVSEHEKYPKYASILCLTCICVKDVLYVVQCCGNCTSML